MKNQKILNRSRFSIGVASAVLGIALVSTPAFAQEAAEDEGEAIVVTGSRIPQPNLEGISPVTTVGAADIKVEGVTRVEDLLNNLPQVFAGQASTLSNGSDGTATVDLRGLGATRTLVLINGRRMMPGDPGTSAADLNAIPESLIKRVEVMTGGASATYGADAVAGVVNFIMDKDFTGLRLDTQYSFYQHNNRNETIRPLLDARTKAGFSGFGYPDGNTTDGGAVSLSAAMGTDFADGRGHVTAYVGYRKINPVTQNNRDYSACTLQNTGAGALQCGGSLTGAPGHVILYDSGTSTVYGFGAGRQLVGGVNRYNFAPTNYFQRPDERYTGGFFADYEISDSIKPYMEFMFMDDRSVAQIAPSGNFGNTLTINCDNPLISAQQAGIICDGENLINGFLGTFPLNSVTNPGPGAINFIDPTTGTTYNKAFFQPLRRNVEGGPRQADLQHTSYRTLVGVKGDIGKAWTYDAYYQFGRTVYAQTYSNEFSVARLTKALDVVAGPGGTPICRSVRDGTDPNCVPYDILSGGTVSAAAVNYLSAIGFQRGTVQQQVANAAFVGNLGEYGLKSPWSENGLSVVFGAEYRKDSVELKTDQAFQTGDLTGQGAPTLPIAGNYNVREFFTEAQLPLVSKGAIYDLSLNAGYRHSSYKVAGGNKFSTDTYKIGVEFAPVRDIRFRAGYNRAVRAPNLQELFATRYVGLDGSSDPCADRVLTAADVGCLAQGLSIGQRVASNPAGQYNGLLGGNINLQPEKSTTKSIGVILEPRFLPNFSMTIDYFDIKLRNAIQGFGSDAIVNTCTSNPTTEICGLVKRNPVTGSLWLTNDGYIENLQRNIGGLQTRGIDFNAAYSVEVGSLGKLSANVVGTYTDKFTVDNGISQTYDCVGYYGSNCSNLNGTPTAPTPKWRHNARLSLATPGGVGLSVQWRHFGSVSDEATQTTNATVGGKAVPFSSKLAAQNYFDLSTSFRFADKFSFRLGVNNIFDKEPPLVVSGAGSYTNSCPTGPCNGNTYPAVYDALGRYIFAGVTLEL